MDDKSGESTEEDDMINAGRGARDTGMRLMDKNTELIPEIR